MWAKLAVGFVGVCVSSLFGGVAYYSSGDSLAAAIAGGIWAIGFILLAVFGYRYDTLEDVWEHDTASTVGQLGLVTVITVIVSMNVTDTITVATIVMGSGIVGYMSGVHHLANSHPAISRNDR